MVEIGTLKNRMKLKAKTDKSPIKKNDTRWGSVFAMLKRYLEMYQDLPSCSFSRSTWSMFLSVEDHYVIEESVGVLYTSVKRPLFSYKLKTTSK